MTPRRAHTAADELTTWPSDATWRGVSPRLLLVRRVECCAVALPTALFAGVSAAEGHGPVVVGLIVAAGVALLAWLWVLAGRQVRAWGYAERDDDLLIRRGVMFTRLVVVPYGRMQFVDVRAGPVERALGIATVQLHTAAAATDARIPGLPRAEAARLRERLTALGQAKAAGL